jgi:hypothetical protein
MFEIISDVCISRKTAAMVVVVILAVILEDPLVSLQSAIVLAVIVFSVIP